MTEKLIGVCLHTCIMEIANGTVKKENVQEIVSACTTEAFLHRVLPEYPKGYWRTEPKKCVRIATDLYKAGLIKFPRDENDTHFPIAPDLVYWVRSPEEIVWFDEN